MFNKEEIDLLNQIIDKVCIENKRHLDIMNNMGDHYYINEGLINEANLKSKRYTNEISVLNEIKRKLAEMSED